MHGVIPYLLLGNAWDTTRRLLIYGTNSIPSKDNAMTTYEGNGGRIPRILNLGIRCEKLSSPALIYSDMRGQFISFGN